MKNFNEISSFIWNVCDDVLRGSFKQHEYGDVILPFVLLRRLDCVIEPKKDEIVQIHKELEAQAISDPSLIIKKQTGLDFYNHSQYDLLRLKSDPNNLKHNFNNYLNGYSNNVEEILRNFKLTSLLERLLKGDKLFILIDKFTEVDLHPDVVDNHTMGNIFEEILRKFSEMSNETSGEHYTPRDIVRLLVAMVFTSEKDNLSDNSGGVNVRSIYDPCCGTGGMLTIGKEWIKENIDSDVKINLYGQELNPQTYSICKSDFLISGENPENIKGNDLSTLSNDQYEGEKFHYMIANPPYGTSWKAEEDEIKEEAKNPNGRFAVGLPGTSDGQLLFVQHMISKMKPTGSRIGIVLNGSPLFNGDAGSGTSEIRKFIIENDLLECIVALPNQLFFNTDINTYIWILNNKKKTERKGKVQLINASSHFNKMKKSLGKKRKLVPISDRNSIVEEYLNFEETDISKIYDNNFFGYTKVTVEQPLEEDGKIVRNKKGEPKADSKKRDAERIPLTGDIDAYFEKEVEPHLPTAWMDRKKDKVGYEINFTKYFYEYQPLRSLEEISKDILNLEKESESLMQEILN